MASVTTMRGNWNICAITLLITLLRGFETVNAQAESFSVRECSVDDNEIFVASSFRCRTCPADNDREVLEPEAAQRIVKWDFSRENIFKEKVTPVQYTFGLDNPRSAISQATQCQCKKGFFESRSESSLLECDDFENAEACGRPSCEPCPANEASTRDRSGCIPCDNNGSSLEDGECKCTNEEHVLIETDEAGELLSEKQCKECPSGRRAFQTDTGLFPGDRYVCAQCPDLHMSVTNDGQCECPNDFRKVGRREIGTEQCVPEEAAAAVFNEFSEQEARLVTYRSFQPSDGAAEETLSNIESLTLRHWFGRAAVDCWAYRDERDSGACDVIASLCVLHLYDDSTPPCQLYNTIASARGRGVNDFAGWPQTLPFLWYTEDTSSVLGSNALQTEMSFDEEAESGTVDTLDLIVASYNLNGTLLDIKPLRHQFMFCSEQVLGAGRPEWQSFGFSTRSQFTCDLESLVRSSFDADGSPTATFYEVFILDKDDASSEDEEDSSSLPMRLFPVPVKIVGVQRDGENVNPSGSFRPDDAFLVRRFFLFDGVSGLTNVDSTPSVIRYARKIRIEIETQGPSDKINPPLINIEYRSRDPGRFSREQSYAKDTVEISSVYFSDIGTFWDVAISFFAISMVTVVVVTGIRWVGYRRKNVRTAIEGTIGLDKLVIWFVFLFSVFAQILFWLLWVLSLYWLVFFKLQDSAFLLLPPNLPDYEDPIYNIFTAIFALVFTGQAIRIMEIVWKQTHLDIFFVDWETKRGPLMETNMDNLERGAKRQDLKYAPISIWRKIFMVNEWSEMQTLRRVYLPFNLVILVAIMEAGKLKNVATARPSESNLSDGDLNPILQFAHSVFWWLILSSAQILWRWGIFERFVQPDPLTRYIDLCTVAKISAFVFDGKYHGYYLHCDAPYEHADINMKQLTDHLYDEKSHARIGRSLKGYDGDPSVQTFELLLPETFRSRIDNIRREFDAESRRHTARNKQQSQGIQGQLEQRVRKPKLTDTREKTLSHLQFKTAEQISKYLKGFVNQSEAGPNLRRIWQEKTYLQRFFDVPWDFQDMEQSQSSTSNTGIVVMAGDPEYKVESVLFRGQEWNLILWDMLVYTLFDMVTESPTIAALITSFFWLILNYIRTELGSQNIARSTMVDDRFLE